jgi:type III secretory pathway component EscS
MQLQNKALELVQTIMQLQNKALELVQTIMQLQNKALELVQTIFGAKLISVYLYQITLMLYGHKEIYIDF